MGRQKKEEHILAPLAGGLVDKVEPLLQYAKPLPPPGSLAEILLLLKSNTDRRLEGLLGITPPPGWRIVPGRRLLVAIRAGGTIAAEFYLSLPPKPSLGSQLLRVKLQEKEAVLMEASFDLRQGLLFLVDD